MDDRNLAAIQAGAGASTGRLKTGTGYRIGQRLVLTAAHVVGALPQIRVWLGHPASGQTGPYAATVVSTGPPDVALLRLEGDVPPFAGGPVRWGRSTGTQPFRYRGLGFPRFGSVEQLAGVVNPLSVGPDGTFPIDQDAFPLRESEWQGASGTALFSDRLLIGVCVLNEPSHGGARLHAVPVDKFHHLVPAEARLESIQLQGLFRSGLRTVAGTPGSLLAADSEVATFHGRDDILGELAGWRDGPRPLSVTLVTAEGGQGKTRLAREFVRLTPDHWVAGFLRDFEPESVARMRETLCPIMLVADYAETVPHRVATLVHALTNDPPARPVRLLLLARHAGAWWEALRADLPGITEAHKPLPPLAPDLARRRGGFRAALDALAARLPDLPDLPPADWPALARELPTPPLAADRFGNVLTLHMAALSALLRAADGGAGDADPEVELLHHERRYQRRAAERRGLLALSPALDPDERRMRAMRSLDRAVAACVLFGPPCDRSRSVVAASLASAAHADDVAGWLGALYPPAATDPEGTVVGAIQPDRLAERMLGQTLLDQPGLLQEVAAYISDFVGAARALTTLVRAATRPSYRDGLAGQITELVAAMPDPFVIAAQHSALTVEEPDALINALLAYGDREPVGLINRIGRVGNSLPRRSMSLAHHITGITALHVRLMRRLTIEHPATGHLFLATALDGHAQRLADVGRDDEALVHSAQSLELCRSLAANDPRTDPGMLAQTIRNHAVRLGRMGYHAEALDHSRQALDLYRKLATVDLYANRRELAGALGNHAGALTQAGRHAEALTYCAQVVVLFRALAADDPVMHLPDVAQALHNHAGTLAKAGHRLEALTVSEQALDLCRRLASAHPDAHLPQLIRGLWGYAWVRMEVRMELEKGLARADEAVSLARALAGRDPEAFAHLLDGSRRERDAIARALGREVPTDGAG